MPIEKWKDNENKTNKIKSKKERKKSKPNQITKAEPNRMIKKA